MALKIRLSCEIRRARWAFPFVALCLGSVACNHINNPYKDSSASINPEMTTASAEGYHDKTEFYVPLHRRGTTTTVCYENGAVTHWPLWFEDPFEDKGNDVTDPANPDAPDNRFAWNWVDYLHMVYGPGRAFFVNGIAWPVSAVVTPPGTLMESDGRISKQILWHDHDAKRSDPDRREPPDGHHIGADTHVEGPADGPVAEPVERQIRNGTATTGPVENETTQPSDGDPDTDESDDRYVP